MARRKAPQNKNAGAAPENKEPFTEDDDMLTAFTEMDAQLRRLLKAENHEWSGTIERRQLRKIADGIRAELRGDQEVNMGGTDDE